MPVRSGSRQVNKLLLAISLPWSSYFIADTSIDRALGTLTVENDLVAGGHSAYLVGVTAG